MGQAQLEGLHHAWISRRECRGPLTNFFCPALKHDQRILYDLVAWKRA
jgi:hypothetical protein